MSNKIRTLEDICLEEGGFYTVLRGNIYCSLAWGRKIDCKYLSEEKDHNGLYTCKRPWLKIKEMLGD